VKQFLLALTLLFPLVSAGCQNGGQATQEATVRNELRAYMDTFKVVDCHEHQWASPRELEGVERSFFTHLAYSYLKADLVSAGSPPVDINAIAGQDVDQLWDTYGPYLELCRNTTYYSHFLKGFKILYGFRGESFSRDNVRALSNQIAANYRDPDWYGQAFEKAGFEVMFVDQYWDNFNLEMDPRFFAVATNVRGLVDGIANRTRLAGGPETRHNPYWLAEQFGVPVNSLDNYLEFADRFLQKGLEGRMICLKNSLAYNRSLDFAEVAKSRAEELFNRDSTTLTPAERKELQDFMFHWLARKAGDYKIPIQIHTGYLAGNGSWLENGRPVKLNNLFLEYPNTKFVLFHGGYPWMGEYGALGKMFPNVYLDLVWLPQISRQAAVDSIDQMLDAVPFNKFFWGGDCHVIEESAGSLALGKDVLAEVLARRVARGLMTRELAREIAWRILRGNAFDFFRLSERLQLSER